MKERVVITYKIKATRGNIREIAEDIALEQTAELPKKAIFYREILKKIVGRIELVRLDTVKISYDISTTDFQLPQFLNLLFGNISMKKGIRVIEIELPEEFVKRFRGPRYGIEGVRKLLNIRRRPILAAALKPMGLSPDKMGEWCYKFAIGGIDIIKDDHGVSSNFEERVKICREAVNMAGHKTGREALYFPNLTAKMEDIEKRIEYGMKIGVKGFLVSPFLLGLDYFRYIAESFPVIFLAHPALSGTFYINDNSGINAEIILGKLFRLIGADIIIFPHSGGRFPFTKRTCSLIDSSLKEDFYHLNKSLPAPAGGIDLKDVPTIREFYGDDVVILIGASLYLKFKTSTGKERR